MAVAILRFTRARMAKTEVVERTRLGPGSRLVVEHLDVTHKRQMKWFARRDRAAGRADKAARVAEKRSRRASALRRRAVDRTAAAESAATAQR